MGSPWPAAARGRLAAACSPVALANTFFVFLPVWAVKQSPVGVCCHTAAGLRPGSSRHHSAATQSIRTRCLSRVLSAATRASLCMWPSICCELVLFSRHGGARQVPALRFCWDTRRRAARSPCHSGGGIPCLGKRGIFSNRMFLRVEKAAGTEHGGVAGSKKPCGGFICSRDFCTRRCWSIMPIRKIFGFCKVPFKMLFVKANTVRREQYR